MCDPERRLRHRQLHHHHQQVGQKNPNAAKLAREYILSDAGQINLARGYAAPSAAT